MDKSLWNSFEENEKNIYPKLVQNKEIEICIIGGGLTGLTLGYYLTKENKKIILLEKDKICNHTSRQYYCKNNKPTWIDL